MGYGPNFLTGGIASADSFYAAGYEADKACDGDTDTWWNSALTAFPHYWEYDLGAGVTKVAARLYFMSVTGGYHPSLKDFILYGSNNYSTWTQLYVGLAPDYYDAYGQWQTFDFANTAAYRYYRVVISSNYTTNTGTAIREIQMMESIYKFDALQLAGD